MRPDTLMAASLHRLLALLLFTSLAACSGKDPLLVGPGDTDAPDTADTGDDTDAPDTADTGGDTAQPQPDADTGGEDTTPPCTFTCPARLTCEDGRVTRWDFARLDCSLDADDCPRAIVHDCTRGCRQDVDELPGGTVETLMCEEQRPKQAGDPCSSEAECLPQMAEPDAHGIPRNVYLRCDLDQQACVAIDPPVVPGYMDTCGASDDDLIQEPIGELKYGMMGASDCPAGLCLIQQSDTCLRQGCTISCEGDQHCPPGSRCVSHITDWGLDQLDEVPSVCKPGRTFTFGVGLSCPPEAP